MLKEEEVRHNEISPGGGAICRRAYLIPRRERRKGFRKGDASGFPKAADVPEAAACVMCGSGCGSSSVTKAMSGNPPSTSPEDGLSWPACNSTYSTRIHVIEDRKDCIIVLTFSIKTYKCTWFPQLKRIIQQDYFKGRTSLQTYTFLDSPQPFELGTCRRSTNCSSERSG